MKILYINKFLYPKGGDAICTLETGAIFASKGHEIAFWGMKHYNNPWYPFEKSFVENVDYNSELGKLSQLKAVFNILYSLESKQKITDVIDIFRPDIIHLHNFAHQISPSIIDVFKNKNIPVVMTMHDYKMICPSYSLLQPSSICNCGLCKNGAYFHCFLKKCVKKSRVKSLVNTIEMYLHHRIWHIYDHVYVYVSPSNFLKEQARIMGFHGRVVYIPNSVDIKAFVPRYDFQDKYIIFFGRLAEGKGVVTLIKAIAGVRNVMLKIIGDGPLKKEVEMTVVKEHAHNVQFLGYKTGDELKEIVRNSMFVVVPSEWYENNPLTVIEAFALGKPVVGARIGGIPELVVDDITGVTFEPCNVEDLRSKIVSLTNDIPRIQKLGKQARGLVEKELNADIYYERLMKIYEEAIQNSNIKG